MICKILEKLKIFIFLCSVLFLSCSGKIQNSYSTESDIAYSDELISYAEDLSLYTDDLVLDDSVAYADNLTEYAEAISYYYFGEWADGVYSVELKSEEYIRAYLELNGSYNLDFEKVLGQMVVGGGIIIITAFVLPAIPVIAGVSSIPASAYLNQACVLAVKITSDAALGAAMDAAISGTLKYIETKGDSEEALYTAIEHSSEGFMWGAVIGSAVESIKTAKLVYQSKKDAEIATHSVIKKKEFKIPEYTSSNSTNIAVDDLDDATKGILEKSNRKIQSLKSENKQLLKDYTEDLYVPLNGNLRAKSKAYDDIAEKISGSMITSEAPVKLYRGISEKETLFEWFNGNGIFNIFDEYGNIDRNRLIGQTIKEYGFMSTSRDSFEALCRGRDVLCRIQAPKGSRMLALESISFFSNEKEILLDKGSRFLIKNVYEDMGRIVLDLQLIP